MLSSRGFVNRKSQQVGSLKTNDRRNTYTPTLKKVQKKISSRKKRQLEALQILDEIIDQVVMNSKQNNIRELMLLEMVETIFVQMNVIHQQQKMHFFTADEQPQSQAKPSIIHDQKQQSYLQRLPFVSQVPVKQIINKRQTIINTSNIEQLNLMKIATQQDNYIDKMREDYLKTLNDVKRKVKNSKISIISIDPSNKKDEDVKKQKLSPPALLEPSIQFVQDLTKNKIKEKNTRKSKNLQNIALVKSLPQSPIKQKQDTQPKSNNLNKKLSVIQKQNTNSQLKQRAASFLNKLGNQPVVDERKQNKTIAKLRNYSLMDLPKSTICSFIKQSYNSNHILGNKQKTEPIQKRTTQFSKDDLKKILIYNKRSSLPCTLLNESIQKYMRQEQSNKKVQEQQQSQIISKIDNKKLKKSETQMKQSNIHLNVSQNGILARKNKKQKSSLSPKNRGTKVTALKVKTRLPQILKTSSQNQKENSVADYSYLSSSPRMNSYSQIHSKFGKDAESKRQIIQLLQALESPHNYQLQPLCSPLPLRLQKIRKYINISKMRKV